MPAERTQRNGFDKLARVYRWMEYLSFGPLLWRVRVAWLPQMRDARNALVLGDGDGRFTAALLRSNPTICVHAVDVSAAMLASLRLRVNADGNEHRLRTTCGNATERLPEGSVELICTYFFLDCLSDAEVRALAQACSARLTHDGRWIVSEFAVPKGPLQVPAILLIRSLYVVFRVLTGLRTRWLPDYALALRAAGLVCVAVQHRLGGILRAEVWQRAGSVERASNET